MLSSIKLNSKDWSLMYSRFSLILKRASLLLLKIPFEEKHRQVLATLSKEDLTDPVIHSTQILIISPRCHCRKTCNCSSYRKATSLKCRSWCRSSWPGSPPGTLRSLCYRSPWTLWRNSKRNSWWGCSRRKQTTRRGSVALQSMLGTQLSFR